MLKTVLDQHMKFDYNNGELKDILLVFKAARFFSPPQMDELKLTPAEIDTLKKFSFFEDSLINRLKEELPSYIVAVEDVSFDVNGVRSNCTLRGPQIQVVGVALIVEFCDHNNNYTFSKSHILVIW